MEDKMRRQSIEARSHAAEKLQALEQQDPVLAAALISAIQALRQNYARARETLELEVKLREDMGALICWNYEKMSFAYGPNAEVPPGEIHEHFHRTVDGVRTKREGCPFDPQTWGAYLD